MFWENIKNYLYKNWPRFLGAFIYGIAIMVFYYFMNKNSGASLLLIACNGSFIGGATLFFFGLLTITTYFGSSDIFSFMFNNHRMEDGRKEDFYNYTIRKKAERKPRKFAFIAYLVVGVLFLIASAIILANM